MERKTIFLQSVVYPSHLKLREKKCIFLREFFLFFLIARTAHSCVRHENYVNPLKTLQTVSVHQPTAKINALLRVVNEALEKINSAVM